MIIQLVFELFDTFNAPHEHDLLAAPLHHLIEQSFADHIHLGMRESIAEFQAKRFTQQWLSETAFEVNRIDADGGEIEIIISGSGDPPPLPELAADLQSNLSPDVKVRLKVVPSQVLRYPELAPD